MHSFPSRIRALSLAVSTFLLAAQSSALLKRLLLSLSVAALLSPVVTFAQKPASSGPPLEDYTAKLKMKPGLVFVCNLSNAHHSDGSVINGDYQSITTITAYSDKELSDSWTMTYPANYAGQATFPNNPTTLKVNIYGGPGIAPPAGYSPWFRVSDALYKAIKSGKKTAFDFDGYSSPGSLQKTAEESLTVLVNERKVKLRTLKTVTPQGWSIWFIDSPDFPMLIKIESPIANWYVGSFTYPGESAKDLLAQLKDKGVATAHGILFEFNSANLTADSKPILNAVADFMKANPKVKLEIEGHTDNIGGAQTNLELSRKRAESVKAYLMQQSGAGADRFVATGMGLTKPVADNAKPEGRALNRRVVFREVK